MRCTLLLLNSMANWSKLAKAWTKNFLVTSEASSSSSQSASRIRPAIERTLPLLQDPSSVPFVCRYRTDVIQPLSTKQIHQLSDHVQKYNSLSSMREKILPFLITKRNQQEDQKILQNANANAADLIFRVETSISKSELDDIYAPFKPPSKGSLEDRIRNEHPHLIAAVDELWDNGKTSQKLSPRDAAVTLLANRIANHVPVMDAAMDFCAKQCRIRVKQAKAKAPPPNRKSKLTSTSTSTSKIEKAKKRKNTDGIGSATANTGAVDADADKYKTYFDFDCRVSFLKEYQTLAIRRGSDKKILKYTFDMDNQRAEFVIARAISSNNQQRHHHRSLYKDAIHDAWTRLIRKRVTTRLWKQSCHIAEGAAIEVFCDNLRKALLAPPLATPTAMLVLDPGFKAGIKCAILDPVGEVQSGSLRTVHFMGNSRENGKSLLAELLRSTEHLMNNNSHDGNDTNANDNEARDDECSVCAVVGNGHGMREARELLTEVAKHENIPIRIDVVNEAGASVWSVTEMASKEFPEQSAAAVAAVSIGRRHQNPLNELVKIPPKSLGLGMYQHDLSEKDLDDKLTATSIDAVAEVGVDINACSVEILEKVPSLTKSMCQTIIKARPLESREKLLHLSGIGPKTYESCAAFVRIRGGSEPLDDTLVHPESYDLARWLLKKLKFKLGKPRSVRKAPSNASGMKEEWSSIIKKGAKRFSCTEERVLIVIEHLLVSIKRPDPRLSCNSAQEEANIIGSPHGCSVLPAELSSTTEALRKSCPVRGVTATVRNVVDFGAFVDFGGENNGLLHRSKMGNVPLGSLLIGQEVGIDILGVSKFDKVSVGLTGQNLPAEDSDDRKRSSAGKSVLGGSASGQRAKRMKIS